LKLNEAELNIIAGWYGAPATKEQQIQLLQDRYHLATVIVTMGGDGAMVAAGGAFYYHPGYKVQVADTIGSGDAFLAGFLFKLFNQAPFQEALDFASALGALIATYNGACPLYEPAEIATIIQANEQPHI
jgi:fructokinase